jgi:hypothetical protein
MSIPPIEGFWLPQQVHSNILTPETEFEERTFANGQPASAQAPGAVTARWPRLNIAQWAPLLEALERNRSRPPQGGDFWRRFQVALHHAGRRLANPSDPLHQKAIQTLPGYTGYSPAMIRLALRALDLFSLEQLPAALSFVPTWQAMERWQSMPGTPGRARFYPQQPWREIYGWSPILARRPIYKRSAPSQLVIGYGAGNVPGAALLIALLMQAVSLSTATPVIVVRNSRHEPIFSSLVLQAMEEADPDLVCTTALLVWDFEDQALQKDLLSRADLVIAAASDETIADLRGQFDAARRSRPATGQASRFHAHGHKVSFSAIGAEMLTRTEGDPDSGKSKMEIAARLAALDSILWDQNGCLSARVHFVEEGAEGDVGAEAYADCLLDQLRLLSTWLPLGGWQPRRLHERFDRYKNLERAGLAKVFSDYDDEFLVILDRRPLEADAFRQQVNDCQVRVIVVRPVAHRMDIPRRYLRMIPKENLQSLSVAIGEPGQALEDGFLQFAAECGACGVTAIRTVGRGAFPQLAYSWDGWIPQDLIGERPPGYFCTIEFDQPYEQILSTYRLMAII